MRISIWLFRYVCASTALSVAWLVATLFGVTWTPATDRGAMAMAVVLCLHGAVLMLMSPRWYLPFLGPLFEATPRRVFAAQMGLLAAAVLFLSGVIGPAIFADGNKDRLEQVFPIVVSALFVCWGLLCIVSEGIGLQALTSTRSRLGLNGDNGNPAAGETETVRHNGSEPSMTGYDVRTLASAVAVGAVAFLIGSHTWPDASAESFLVSTAILLVIIGLRTDGWREMLRSLGEGLFLWLLGAGLWHFSGKIAEWLDLSGR